MGDGGIHLNLPPGAIVLDPPKLQVLDAMDDKINEMREQSKRMREAIQELERQMLELASSLASIRKLP
jgi:hypothetical protein